MIIVKEIKTAKGEMIRFHIKSIGEEKQAHPATTPLFYYQK